MKKQLTLLVLMAMSSFVYGQTDSTKTNNEDSTISIMAGGDGLTIEVQTIDTVTGEANDTTRLQMGKSTILIINDGHETEEETVENEDHDNKMELTYWSGIDLGVNMFIDKNMEFGAGENTEYLDLDVFNSTYLAVNIAEWKLRLIKDYVGVFTGLGYESKTYRFKNDHVFAFNKDTLVAFVDSTISMKKNRLGTHFVTVPLMLEFNTSLSDDNNVHLAGGVIGGYNFANVYTRKFKRDGNRERVDHSGRWNVERWKLDAMVRVGYKSFNLIAAYQINSLFKEGTAPEVHPLSVGLTIVAFN